MKEMKFCSQTQSHISTVWDLALSSKIRQQTPLAHTGLPALPCPALPCLCIFIFIVIPYCIFHPFYAAYLGPGHKGNYLSSHSQTCVCPGTSSSTIGERPMRSQANRRCNLSNKSWVCSEVSLQQDVFGTPLLAGILTGWQQAYYYVLLHFKLPQVDKLALFHLRKTIHGTIQHCCISIHGDMEGSWPYVTLDVLCASSYCHWLSPAASVIALVIFC